MKIGNLEIGIGAGLAPMAGVTDAAMRVLCHEQGAAWAVSEMLSAKGWIYGQGKNRNALDLLRRWPGEGITGLQLFGREPEFIERAIHELEETGFDYIDLNFGCPAPKITGNGEGSALMREPKQLEKVVKAAVEATDLPVTVKIRSGWDENCINATEVAVRCEQAGAAAVTVHARTRMQQYSGKADRNVIRAVRKAVSIPVFGNGDITSGADAVSMIEETGCDAVMVGRAAQGNPWLFAEIRAALTGEKTTPPTPLERMQTAIRHFEMEQELYGLRKGLLDMCKHIAWYTGGMSGSAHFRTRINTMSDPEQVKQALLEFAAENE